MRTRRRRVLIIVIGILLFFVPTVVSAFVGGPWLMWFAIGYVWGFILIGAVIEAWRRA